MSENEKINNEKRSLSVDDILAEARERRAKKLALDDVLKEAEEAVVDALKEVSPFPYEVKETPIIHEEITEESVETIEEIIEEPAAEESEELDELLEIENIEDTEALNELKLLDGEEETEEAEVIEETINLEEAAEEKKKKRNFTEVLYEWVGEIVIAVAIVAVLFSFFFRVVTVFGASMEPNFYGEDKLIVSSFLHNVEQGDVVVATDVLDTPIIKRVIAVGGQTVDIDNETGTVYVDGKALDESSYIKNGITFSNGADKISFPLTVKEGHYFLLGDNRMVSQDSRFISVGQVSEDKILGEVKVRIFPFSEFKLYF